MVQKNEDTPHKSSSTNISMRSPKQRAVISVLGKRVDVPSQKRKKDAKKVLYLDRI